MSNLFIFGLCAHLFADWFLQNEWQATNKVSLSHPAAYVHSGLHVLCLLLFFPWLVALAIGVTHILIDTRKPLQWWREMIGQTQVKWDHYDPIVWTKGLKQGLTTGKKVVTVEEFHHNSAALAVAFWQDQVAHILVIAVASWWATA